MKVAYGSDATFFLTKARNHGHITTIPDANRRYKDLAAESLSRNLLVVISRVEIILAAPCADPPSVSSDFIGIEGWRTVTVSERPDEFIVVAEPIERREACPHCGAGRPKFRANGHRRWRYIRDLPRAGKRVTIKVRTQQYRCLSCRRTCSQPAPGIQPSKKVTKRLVAWLAEFGWGRTAVSAAKWLGISDRTTRNYSGSRRHSISTASTSQISLPSGNQLVSFNRQLCEQLFRLLNELLDRGIELLPVIATRPWENWAWLSDRVSKLIPSSIDAERRGDIHQEIMTALFIGEIFPEDIERELPRFIKGVYRLHPTKYGPLSLDQPVSRDGTGATLGELLEG
jgi:hypothetical protein